MLPSFGNSMPHSKRTSVNLQNHLAPARSSVKRPTRQNLPVNTTAYLERSFAALFALTRSTRLSRRRLTLRTRYHHAETRQPVYMFLRSLAIISSHLFLVRQLYLRKTTAFQDGNTSNSATQPACITQAAKLQEFRRTSRSRKQAAIAQPHLLSLDEGRDNSVGRRTLLLRHSADQHTPGKPPLARLRNRRVCSLGSTPETSNQREDMA